MSEILSHDYFYLSTLIYLLFLPSSIFDYGKSHLWDRWCTSSIQHDLTLRDERLSKIRQLLVTSTTIPSYLVFEKGTRILGILAEGSARMLRTWSHFGCLYGDGHCGKMGTTKNCMAGDEREKNVQRERERKGTLCMNQAQDHQILTQYFRYLLTPTRFEVIVM